MILNSGVARKNDSSSDTILNKLYDPVFQS